MRPKSFSATAFHVAELCLARYKCEMIDRSKGMSGTAANLGTSVHGALEMYVKAVYLVKVAKPDFKYLTDLFRMSYMQTFDTTETNTVEYIEGLDMLRKWHKRTDFSKFEVISCEIKETFPILTSIGEIPFNYIWDRHDQIGPHEYRVVDYKTNKWGINPQDLEKKIQARAYALAAQIRYPDAERIWVQFDMLRHDGPVGIVFSRDDNIATWKSMKAMAERIIETPDDEAPETLNTECLFCPRKQSCKALMKNVDMGGIMSISTPQEAVDQRALLEFQKKAVVSAIQELDTMILAQAKVEDVMQYESEVNRLNIGVSSRRNIDAERVERIIGEDLFNRYGGKSFTIANTEFLLKGTELTPEQKKELKDQIYMKQGEPSVKVEAKSEFED